MTERLRVGVSDSLRFGKTMIRPGLTPKENAG